jgi:hypothetical protein
VCRRPGDADLRYGHGHRLTEALGNRRGGPIAGLDRCEIEKSNLSGMVARDAPPGSSDPASSGAARRELSLWLRLDRESR